MPPIKHARRPAVVFADPPYTAAGAKHRRRLYVHDEIENAALFATLAATGVDFLMTYDYSQEMLALVETHRFSVVQVRMKSTHHRTIKSVPELVIMPRPLFD